MPETSSRRPTTAICATWSPRLVPTPFGWVEQPIELPRFFNLDLRASYVFLRDDVAAPRELFEKMAARLGQPLVVECIGSHEAMLTHPDEVAHALIAATEA